jgi:predicted O-methyltransferase YrrM
VIAEDLFHRLAELGVDRPSIAAYPDTRSLAQALRQALERGVGEAPGQRTTVLGVLLSVLEFDGRYDEIHAALRAPWCPVRDESDEHFDRMYVAAIAATEGRMLPLKRRVRFRSLAALLSRTRGVAGAVAECGCFRGLSSHIICQVLAQERPGFDGAGFHIFDSFAGLSEPTAKDAIPDTYRNAAALRDMTVRGAFAATLESVRRHLAQFARISYHPGWIPETFQGLPEARYRFVHVDVDLYQPTHHALEYFYDRLSPQGMIVSDDYTWPGARQALEEHAALHGLQLEMPGTGQAVLRKPV